MMYFDRAGRLVQATRLKNSKHALRAARGKELAGGTQLIVIHKKPDARCAGIGGGKYARHGVLLHICGDTVALEKTFVDVSYSLSVVYFKKCHGRESFWG